MDDSKLSAIVGARIDTAVNEAESREAERKKAEDYYNGELLGTEEEGRSQIVSRDVAEAVDSVMPGLMKIFTSGEKVVNFEPTGSEDVAGAEQATDYINHIWHKQNDGFLNFHNWFKSSLMKKLGVVKVWWDDSEISEPEVYRSLTAEEIQILEADEDLTISDIVDMEDGTFRVRARRSNKNGYARVECVMPDEFIYIARNGSIDDGPLVGQRTRKTISDLVDDGFDRDTVEGLQSAGSEDDEEEDGSMDPSMREVWVEEVYMRLDYDEDGIAELRKIIRAGDTEILVNEEVDGHPFATVTPVPMPGMVEGKSIYDQTADIQMIKSTLQRQMFDNLYLANTPRTEVLTDRVNLDDLLNPVIGGLVRVKEMGAIREIVTPFTAAETFPMLEYLDTTREQRTGVTRYNQGMDPNSLNKTATGINIISQAGQQRQELIARVFAETGVKTAFRKLFELVCKHQTKSAIIRLRGEFVTIDPAAWNHKMDMTVAVGLGTGNKDQQLAHLMTKAQLDARIIQLQGGLKGPLITAKNVYNTLEKIIEAMGLNSVEQYYTDPDTAEQEPPQGPSPEEQAMQMQMQMQQQSIQFQQQLEQMKAQFDMQIKQEKAQADVQVSQFKAKSQVEIDQFKAQQQSALETKKAITRAELDLNTAEESARLERDRATEHARLDRDKAETGAHLQQTKVKLDAHLRGQNE